MYNYTKKTKYQHIWQDAAKVVKLYSIDKKSLKEICNIYNITSNNTIRQILIRHNISLRNVSQSLTVNNDPVNLNWNVIIGSLLGDAGLSCYNRYSENSYPAFYKKNKYYDHVVYVARHFYNNYKNYIAEETRRGNVYFKFKTSVNFEFKSLYKQWYPVSNNFVKVVPINLELNPQILLHWFLDDGSTSWRHQTKSKSVRLTFSSESFEYMDQFRLSEMINDQFKIKAKLTPVKTGFGWRIKILNESVEKFFDLIGPCPVPNLCYKWKLPVKSVIVI